MAKDASHGDPTGCGRHPCNWMASGGPCTADRQEVADKLRTLQERLERTAIFPTPAG